MPKSRGRKPPHRSPQPPRAPASWEAGVLRSAKELLDPETTRTDAELLVGEALGTAEAEPDAAVALLLARADRVRTPSSAALVAALSLVVDAPAVEAALSSWAQPLLQDVPWCSAPRPALVRASRAADPWDDQAVAFLEFEDVTIVVHTSRGAGDAALSIAVTMPGTTAAWDAEGEWPRTAMDPDEAADRVRGALATTEMWWPPHDDEAFRQHRLVLASRLRALPAPPVDASEWEPLDDQQQQELVDAFFGEVALERDDVSEELVDLCVRFADGYVPGGVLAWSPDIVERFLLDWVPRKTVLDQQRRDRLPAVTCAFVGWALLRHGVAPDAADEAAQVALELRDEYLAAHASAEPGPATALLQRLPDAGVDPTDPEALQRAVAAYNAEVIAERG